MLTAILYSVIILDGIFTRDDLGNASWRGALINYLIVVVGWIAILIRDKETATFKEHMIQLVKVILWPLLVLGYIILWIVQWFKEREQSE